jgi:hypothetical protein
MRCVPFSNKDCAAVEIPGKEFGTKVAWKEGLQTGWHARKERWTVEIGRSESAGERKIILAAIQFSSIY